MGVASNLFSMARVKQTLAWILKGTFSFGLAQLSKKEGNQLPYVLLSIWTDRLEQTV